MPEEPHAQSRAVPGKPGAQNARPPFMGRGSTRSKRALHGFGALPTHVALQLLQRHDKSVAALPGSRLSSEVSKTAIPNTDRLHLKTLRGKNGW